MVTADFSEGPALRAAVGNGVLDELYAEMFGGVDFVDKTVYGKRQRIITPRPSTRIGRDSKGYMRRKKSVRGVCYQARLHLLYVFKEAHDNRENLVHGSDVERLYRAVMEGRSLVSTRLDCSHRNHNKDDVLCLLVEPKETNVSRSHMDCFDRMVCTSCPMKMAYPCPHTPRCTMDVETICSSCA